MMRRIMQFLRGMVWLEVECPCPERIWNLCALYGIPFWDVRWRDETHFTLRTTRRGARTLRQAASELPVTFRRRREKGAPLLLWRLRRRYVLAAGTALVLALTVSGQIFVWDFRVSGNETVPTETILRALEEYGVTVGSRALDIDQEDLRNHVLLELRDISWLAVNVRGCTAHVQVVERHRPPEIIQERQPSNVVAARAGLVTKVEAWDGRAEVQPGATVTEGELLISGVVDSERTGVRLLHGMGRVWGRTWYELAVLVPLEKEVRESTGKTEVHYALDVGKHRINFFGRGSQSGPDCDKITQYQPLTLPGGYRLPLTLVREELTPCTVSTVKRSREEALEEGKEWLLSALQDTMTAEGTVQETRFAGAVQPGGLLVTMTAECLEQIGVPVPLAAP